MAWPPLSASADDQEHGRFTLVARPGGTLQWAYRGRPLYAYVGDRRPGDRIGDNLVGLWHVVRVEGGAR